MIKNLKYYILLLIILASGAFLLNTLLCDYKDLEQEKIEEQLSKTHNSAMLNAKAGIKVYATIVSSLKSYFNNTQGFPTELELQAFLKDILNDIRFKDFIVVSFLDKNHVFKYVITPDAIDEVNLKGVSLKNIKSKESIDKLDKLMLTENISLFAPINLREGWAGFPFNFAVRNNKNEVLGYVAPIIDVKYLLGYFYEGNMTEKYVHKFLINDTIDLTREVYYDDSEIFNKARDIEYYKNFNIDEAGYNYSSIELFNLKLKVGSAYKNRPKINNNITKIAYAWYVLLSFLSIVTLYQYLKNRRLNNRLEIANTKVVSKNQDLEKNLDKIQTLIKEIHHRVKNNMAMVSGILNMQEDEYEDENIKKALRSSQNRIQSMSLVHEKLYNTSTFKDVNIKEYIIQLIEYVEATIRNDSMVLEKHIQVDAQLVFNADTTANLGLIINELVTNSFKHAFGLNKENRMQISITKETESYKLEYKDCGTGLPDNFNIETVQSLGMQLIHILTQQLDGKFEYTKTPENTFIIYFKPLESTLFE